MYFSPIRLRDIRIVRGYTVEHVAQQIGVTKQAISKYETGKTIPSTGVLGRIIKFFDLPDGYLTKPELFSDKQSLIFYRRHKRTTVREIEEAEVNLKWCYEMIRGCKDFYPLKKSDIPYISSNLHVEERAMKLREYWGLGHHPIENLSLLLEEKGFYLFSLKLKDEKIDGFSRMVDDIPIIFINQNRRTRERQQFSIAHELAHLILHSDMQEESTIMEEEADSFAGAFLMPETAVRADIIRNDIEFLTMLAKKWHVSVAAIVERCKELKLLGNTREENLARAEGLFRNINANYKGKPVYRSDMELCSLREIILNIANDYKAIERFLQILSLPKIDVERICNLNNELLYGYSPSEQAENMAGVQLSFDF